MITIEEEQKNLPKVIPAPVTDVFFERAKLLEKSQFLPTDMNCRTTAQVLAWAQHLGIPEANALSGMSIIKGRPYIGADLQAAMAKASGITITWVSEKTRGHCTYAYSGGGYDEPTEFTAQWDDFKHLHSSSSWKNYPGSMLAARCLTMGLKRLFPGLFAGIYPADEAAEVNPTTEVTKLKGVDKALALIEDAELETT